MSHPSQYFKTPEASTEEMMREWMARQMEANERMKNQPTKSLPHITNIKPRHEFVYKPPSIRNKNDKGDVKDIEENETQPIPTMPNQKPINSNSPTVYPFLNDGTVHIPYTNTKKFADDVSMNNVGDKELKSIDGIGNGRMTKKEIKKDDMGLPKESNKEWKLNDKMVPHKEEVYHYQWHPTKILHLNPGSGGRCLEAESIDLTRLC
ncbi:hypothetical protein Tco_0389725 [Tanacetum coccineum]